MIITQERPESALETPKAKAVDMKLEVVVIPISDADRAAEFYQGRLGWRVDADLRIGNGRLLQVTPPGSPTSIIFGTGISPAAPGSAKFLYLVVSDIEAAQEELIAKGIATSGIFHDGRGGYNAFDPSGRASGLDPERRSYASYLTFSDPDGNEWLLQEVTTRFPGRIAADGTSFSSVADLERALGRAAAAHGEHEKRLGGGYDAGWPAWYAAYMAAEQSGTLLPS